VSPAWIRKRKTGAGDTRHQVLYRRAGRETTIKSAGTFKRDREAKLRRDLVAGWLALGLDPKTELAKLQEPAPVARSFAEEALALIATRHDAAGETVRSKRKALAKIRELRPDLAAKPAVDWEVRDVQELVAAMVEAKLAPATIDKYVTDGPKLVLEFAGLDPNPARDRRVKLPRIVRAETKPPTDREVLALLELVPLRLVLALIVLEQTAMRVGELVTLPWGDVDVVGDRFRLSRERVKTRHPRWVQLPGWLMNIVAASCPPEDRTETRHVFQTTEATLRQAMARACRAAGIPLYSPHDLRHRRASLWHGQGLSMRELMERGGWAKSELPVDLYTHVMPLDEVSREELERVLVRTR
jgi:integrase